MIGSSRAWRCNSLMERFCYIVKGGGIQGSDDSVSVCSLSTKKVSNKNNFLSDKNVVNRTAAKVPHNDDEKDIDSFTCSGDPSGSGHPSYLSDLTSSDQSVFELDDDLQAQVKQAEEQAYAEVAKAKTEAKTEQRKRRLRKYQQQEEVTKKKKYEDRDDSNAGVRPLPMKGEAGA